VTERSGGDAEAAAKLERVYVWLVALHSFAIGVGLVFLTDFSLRFAGWGEPDPAFFPRQGGAFHFVVAAGYLIEHLRHRTVTLMITAKSIAFVFLIGLTLTSNVPWAVPFSGVADGVMGLLAYVLHRRTVRLGAAASPSP
jgi:hypothetical protein